MAQYRFSASIIGRSEGRSVTAAAAYRAAESIHDHRTGQTHDYTAKRGVLHTEIMLPENTPDWMADRSKLWNAVEAAERRKDSQLAREVLLSLPHEISHEQRKELVRGFVQERFSNQGMVADIAIHAPGKEADERNYHAHVLLTMRELTSDGFGMKVRLSEPERLARIKEDREAWATHQNRMFERLNMPQRVDHRSYLEQGIDRAPTIHMGPFASELEKRGKPSELGDKNRAITADNSRIAESYRLQAEAESVRKVIPYKSPLPRLPATPTFNLRADPKALTRSEEAWRQRNHERTIQIERRELYETIELGRKHESQKHRLLDELETRNAPFRATIKGELDAIERRLQAKGVTKFFRDLSGRTRSDKVSRELHEKTLERITERETEEKKALEQRQANERVKLIDRYRKYHANLERKIAMEIAQRQANRTGRMDDKEKKYERRPPLPPKPEPSLKPAPPRGAGQTRTTSSPEGFERAAKEWSRTEEGRKRLGKDPSPNRNRVDFTQASKPEKTAEPTRDGKPRTQDYERPNNEPTVSKQRSDFAKSSEPERKTDKQPERKPSAKRDFDRDRD